MRVRWTIGLACLLALGCGSRKFAPVSGKVTLNGKPLPNATVAFNPIPREGSSEAGPSSIGTTNDKGEFTLRVDLHRWGAVVGKHRVAISAMSRKNGDGDARGAVVNTVPGRYNAKSKLTFEVPSGGTDQANFELEFP
jgi:hypothetical protein